MSVYRTIAKRLQRRVTREVPFIGVLPISPDLEDMTEHMGGLPSARACDHLARFPVSFVNQMQGYEYECAYCGAGLRKAAR